MPKKKRRQDWYEHYRGVALRCGETQRVTERRSGTVTGSTGSGGSTGPRVVQNAFMASQIELKGGAAGETFAVQVLHWTTPNN